MNDKDNFELDKELAKSIEKLIDEETTVAKAFVDRNLLKNSDYNNIPPKSIYDEEKSKTQAIPEIPSRNVTMGNGSDGGTKAPFNDTKTIPNMSNGVNNSPPKKKLDKNSIILSTFHGSKGLEWENVFLIGLNEKYPNLDKCENILEEVNTFYVAITRAKTNMYISEIDGGCRFVEEYFK